MTTPEALWDWAQWVRHDYSWGPMSTVRRHDYLRGAISTLGMTEAHTRRCEHSEYHVTTSEALWAQLASHEYLRGTMSTVGMTWLLTRHYEHSGHDMSTYEALWARFCSCPCCLPCDRQHSRRWWSAESGYRSAANRELVRTRTVGFVFIRMKIVFLLKECIYSDWIHLFLDVIAVMNTKM